MRLEHLDNLHGSAALAFIVATFAGWSIPQWASLASLIYVCILIGEKVVRWVMRWRGKEEDAPNIP